ncbi:MAG: glutathione synthase, partial [Clostridia bacterium]|nr:glutathione synthase [Clostridia bacterium]
MDTSKLYTGHYGLERETLRVGEDGKLAQTAHPFDDKRLDRDFCENQLEIITPVCGSIDELM